MTNYDDNDMMKMFSSFSIRKSAVQAIVKQQGVTNLDVLMHLDIDGIAQLCDTIRQPDSPDTGHFITTISEVYLEKAVYYLKYLKRTSRVLHPAKVTIAKIQAMTVQQQAEMKHKNLLLPPAIDFVHRDQTWLTFFQSLDNILRNTRGSSGNPLSYCVRKQEAVMEDPPDGWYSHDEELINRAPIRIQGQYDRQFVVDNTKVWNIIATLTEPHNCHAVAKMNKAHSRQDGRQAYQNLYDLYCGPNFAANQVTEARLKLQSLAFHGETESGDFDKFVTLHVAQHNIIDSFPEIGSIDDLAKVMYLLSGIQCPLFHHARIMITTDPKYHHSFDLSVQLCRSCICVHKLSVQRSRKRRRNGSRRSNTSAARSVRFRDDNSPDNHDNLIFQPSPRTTPALTRQQSSHS